MSGLVEIGRPRGTGVGQGWGRRRWARRVSVIILWVVAAAWPAWGKSIGISPSGQDGYFFPGDTATVRFYYTLSTTDTDVLGYEAEVTHVPGTMFASFARTPEIRTLQVAEPGPGGHVISFYVGKLGADIVLDPSGTAPKVRCENRYLYPPPPDPNGVGLIVGVEAEEWINLKYLAPQNQGFTWTLHNTSGYDVYDGVLRLTGTAGGYYRFIDGLNIPAGGSLEVSGQMLDGWEWSFGGMLNSPTPSPVVAFDEPSGLSPLGKSYEEVIDAAYPTSGLEAADAGYRQRSGYDCVFSPPLVGHPVSFSLYAFTDGQLVGQGSAAQIPEPGTLSVLILAGLLTLRRRR